MWALYVLIGILGGVLSGMGMGGGTLIIPMLTFFLGIYQKQAQFLNIISFIFMALFIAVFQLKSGFIKVFPAIVFAIPGFVSSFFAAFLVKNMPENILKIVFGVFLIIIALIQAFVLIKKKKERNTK